MIVPEVETCLDSTLNVAYPALSRESNTLQKYFAQQTHRQSTQDADKITQDDAEGAKGAHATGRSDARNSRGRSSVTGARDASRAIGSVLRLVHENSLLPPPVKPKQDPDIVAP